MNAKFSAVCPLKAGGWIFCYTIDFIETEVLLIFKVGVLWRYILYTNFFNTILLSSTINILKYIYTYQSYSSIILPMFILWLCLSIKFLLTALNFISKYIPLFKSSVCINLNIYIFKLISMLKICIGTQVACRFNLKK